MRFSHLLTQLSEVGEATPCRIGSDPELEGAESIERAGAAQLSFLEAGNALTAALAASAAGAVLLPARGDDAASSESRADGRAGAELRAA